MKFQHRLKELRKEFNLTGEDLGKLFNVSKTAVSNWESGNRNPDIETLIKIANYFNVSVDYLLGNSNIKSCEEEKDLFKLFKIHLEECKIYDHKKSLENFKLAIKLINNIRENTKTL